MGIHNIEKPSFRYKILKLVAGFWHNHVYYKKVVVEGRENIPENGHLIFTPNHQNALNDALAVLFAIDNQLVFVARSDIFKKKFVASILYFLKILPIYRIRDGYETLKKNEDTFKKTVDVIANHNGLVILPEGNHSGIKRLRPLKKGFARIAFQAESENDFNLGIQVVPVGIDYEHYQNFRTTLYIQFGKPLDVAKYKETYKEDAVTAINQIKNDLSAAMKPLILDIESKTYYDTYNWVIQAYLLRMARHMGLRNARQPNRIKAKQEIIRQLAAMEESSDKQLVSLDNMVQSYQELLNENSLVDQDIAKGKTAWPHLLLQSILLICLFPIFLIGFVINIIPFRISVGLSNKIKDPQFQSSIKFGLSFVSFPLIYAVQFIIIGLAFQDWGVAAAFLLGIPLWSLLSWKYYKKLKRLSRLWSMYKFIKKQAAIYTKLAGLRLQIFSLLDKALKVKT